MFHNLSPAMLARMTELEAIDTADRADGTPHNRRLRQIPPDTGRYLAILASSAPAGQVVEVGTSAGFSALWLSLACRQRGDVLTSIDRDPDKAGPGPANARPDRQQRRRAAGFRRRPGHCRRNAGVAFAFVDANRDVLLACVELLADRLVPGGLVAVDNVISNAAEIPGVLERILADPRLDAVVVPIGSGVLTARRTAR